MTPPFDRLRGSAPLTLPTGLDHFSLEGGNLHHPGPAIAETTMLHQRFFGSQGLEELTRLTGTEQPDVNLLPQAIEEGLTHARAGNPSSYLTVLRMISSVVVLVEDEEQRESFRGMGRQVAQEALEAYQNSDLNSREKVRRLYDIAMATGNILVRPNGEAMADADRETMQHLFTAIQEGIAINTRESSVEGSHIAPLPEYLVSFTTAQLAMLSGETQEAMQALLHTRSVISALPEPTTRGGIRDQIALSTEMALQALPRDASGVYAETFQTHLSYELLSYFYEVDYLAEHGEDQIQTAQNLAQQFNLVASLAAEYNLHPDEESGEFSETDRQILTQIVDTLYSGNEEFRESTEHWNLGEMGDKDERETCWATLLSNVSGVYAHIHAHREAEPYQSVLAHQSAQQRIARLGEFLSQHAPLNQALTESLLVNEESPGNLVVQQLIEYGPNLPALLESLPEELRENHEYADFFNQARSIAEGFRGDGLRHNLIEPTREFMQTCQHLAEEHPQYAPAFSALFQNLSELEQVVPNLPFPEELRNEARGMVDTSGDINWEAAVRNVFTNPESIAMILGGTLFTELGSAWLLGGARIPFLRSAEVAAGIRNSGNLASLVRGGSLTWGGEMMVGFGVAAGMSLASGTVHCSTSDRPFFEEAGRILPGLALGTLVSGFALAGMMGSNFALRRTLLSESRIASPFLRSGLQRVLGIGIGSGMMLGAGVVTRGLMTGTWEAPTRQEVVEMTMTMAAWDMASLGLRHVGSHLWWSRQLGPYRAQQVERLVTATHQANPEIDVNFLRNYLGMRLASGVSLQEYARAIQVGDHPILEGEGRGRRLVFRRSGSEPVQDPVVSRILQSSEFEESMESIHREVIARLSGGTDVETVTVSADRRGERIEFRILSREAAEANPRPRNTFRVGPNGVPTALDAIDDAALQTVLTEYGRELQSSGRAAMRQTQFERMPRRRTPSRRLGSTADSPPPPPPTPERTGSADQEMTPIPALTRTQRAMLELISGSTEYQEAVVALRRDVQSQISARPGATEVWVRATRSGESVRFQIFSAEPGASPESTTFKMDAQGRVSCPNGTEPILSQLVSRMERMPSRPVIPPTARDEEEDASDLVEEVEGEDEVVPEMHTDSSTLRPARVPEEARRIPPALPRGDRPVDPVLEGDPSDTFSRRMRDRARSLPAPLDPDATLGVDQSGLARLETQRNNYLKLNQELDRLASTLEDLQRSSGNPNVFIEIDPSAEHWFSVIRPSQMRRNPRCGYFVLEMVPSGVSGTDLPRLDGEPITDNLNLDFGIRERDGAGTPHDLTMSEILQRLFSR